MAPAYVRTAHVPRSMCRMRWFSRSATSAKPAALSSAMPCGLWKRALLPTAASTAPAAPAPPPVPPPAAVDTYHGCSACSPSVTRRTQWLPPSVTSAKPRARSMVTEFGKKKRAAPPGPFAKPKLPPRGGARPATVVTRPTSASRLSETRRSAWLPQSVTSA